MSIEQGIYGYEPDADDPIWLDDSIAASMGAQADTFYDGDTRMHATAEMHHVQDRLERGEIDEEEATTLLDILASQQDS